ncbi:MAG: neutral/alkaline non-lysosomal ceramidase N-terminal domain-containing protein, partial [Verrucomicrobiota bacterium]
MKTISLRRSPTSSGGVPEKKFHPTTSLRLGARSAPRIFGCWLLLLCIGSGFCAEIEKGVALEAGLARRDITPHPPIWLAGYAARNRAADQVDHRLMANALALKDATGSKFVFVGLDNCEVSHQFGGTVVREAEAKHGLPRGAIMIVSSHTHSAPVLENTLEIMAPASEVERERIRQYSQFLRTQLLDVVRGALADLQPARLEFGNGRARFAINRRVYQEDKINFGENPDGPVDWDVPVLKVRGTNDAVRGVIFGYACHGTSISGNDFYKISGDYMAYAREHIESHFPGATAVFLTGMGGDSNPSPRGTLLDAKRHGLELAGAVVGVLSRP